MTKAKKKQEEIPFPITKELFVIFDDSGNITEFYKDYDEMVACISAAHNPDFYHGLPVHVFGFDSIKKLVIGLPFLDEFGRNDS